MSVLIVASSEGRAGRSLVAAAVAYRLGRAGTAVTLARLAGDGSADADAKTFASLEGVASPGRALSVDDAKAVAGNVVLEAPPGAVAALVTALNARVLVVDADPGDVAADAFAGRVLTRVPAAQVAAAAGRPGVLAVLPEDAVLAAPSLDDIAAAVDGRWLVGDPAEDGVERVMIGTVASDSASPYFGARAGKCVVTRADKVDLQLAALQGDVRCLVITGGGEPSPYIIDRVRSIGDGVALLLAPGSTVETMRAIEPLYGLSGLDGQPKLERAVALLDAANAPVEI
jgi:BioD-like phosphotransacetylase family protein